MRFRGTTVLRVALSTVVAAVTSVIACVPRVPEAVAGALPGRAPAITPAFVHELAAFVAPLAVSVLLLPMARRSVGFAIANIALLRRTWDAGGEVAEPWTAVTLDALPHRLLVRADAGQAARAERAWVRQAVTLPTAIVSVSVARGQGIRRAVAEAEADFVRALRIRRSSQWSLGREVIYVVNLFAVDADEIGAAVRHLASWRETAPLRRVVVLVDVATEPIPGWETLQSTNDAALRREDPSWDVARDPLRFPRGRYTVPSLLVGVSFGVLSSALISGIPAAAGGSPPSFLSFARTALVLCALAVALCWVVWPPRFLRTGPRTRGITAVVFATAIVMNHGSYDLPGLHPLTGVWTTAGQTVMLAALLHIGFSMAVISRGMDRVAWWPIVLSGASWLAVSTDPLLLGLAAWSSLVPKTASGRRRERLLVMAVIAVVCVDCLVHLLSASPVAAPPTLTGLDPQILVDESFWSILGPAVAICAAGLLRIAPPTSVPTRATLRVLWLALWALASFPAVAAWASSASTRPPTSVVIAAFVCAAAVSVGTALFGTKISRDRFRSETATRFVAALPALIGLAATFDNHFFPAWIEVGLGGLVAAAVVSPVDAADRASRFLTLHDLRSGLVISAGTVLVLAGLLPMVTAIIRAGLETQTMVTLARPGLSQLWQLTAFPFVDSSATLARSLDHADVLSNGASLLVGIVAVSAVWQYRYLGRWLTAQAITKAASEARSGILSGRILRFVDSRLGQVRDHPLGSVALRRELVVAAVLVGLVSSIPTPDYFERPGFYPLAWAGHDGLVPTVEIVSCMVVLLGAWVWRHGAVDWMALLVVAFLLFLPFRSSPDDAANCVALVLTALFVGGPSTVLTARRSRRWAEVFVCVSAALACIVITALCSSERVSLPFTALNVPPLAVVALAATPFVVVRASSASPLAVRVAAFQRFSRRVLSVAMTAIVFLLAFAELTISPSPFEEPGRLGGDLTAIGCYTLFGAVVLNGWLRARIILETLAAGRWPGLRSLAVVLASRTREEDARVADDPWSFRRSRRENPR